MSEFISCWQDSIFTMDLMWLFTVPILKLAIKIGILLAALFLIIQIIRWAIQSKPPNPFTRDIREPRKPYQHDQKKRDAVLKQGFSMDKVKDRESSEYYE